LTAAPRSRLGGHKKSPARASGRAGTQHRDAGLCPVVNGDSVAAAETAKHGPNDLCHKPQVGDQVGGSEVFDLIGALL